MASSFFLYKSVKVKFTGRPSLKNLRAALTQIAKHSDLDAKVTLRETENGRINSDPVNLTVSWGEWS